MHNLPKKTIGLTKGAITLGALHNLPYTSPALTPISNQFPVLGSLTGASMVLDSLKSFKKK